MIKVTYVETEKLKPYKNNARIHTDEQIEQLVKSIQEYGWTNPVLIDGDKTIVAGHARVMAAQKAGIEKVPCITLAQLTEAQRKAYVIADNKLALNASWDEHILSEEFAWLKEAEFDLTSIGFMDEEIERILNNTNWEPDFDLKEKQNEQDNIEFATIVVKCKLDDKSEVLDLINNAISHIDGVSIA